MKIAFLVLLMAAAVFALWDDRVGRRIKHTPAHHPDLNLGPCKMNKDCEKICDLQCYDDVDALCIDGTCFCELEEDKKK